MLKLVNRSYRCMWLKTEDLASLCLQCKTFSILTYKRKTCTPGFLSLITSQTDYLYEFKNPIRELSDVSSEGIKRLKYGHTQQGLKPNKNHSSHPEYLKFYPYNFQSHNLSEDYIAIVDNNCNIQMETRKWEVVNKSGHDTNKGKNFQFKVLSYNVLAQKLLECHPYLYTDCQPHTLKWNYRANLLFNEIVRLDPDVICLQEVQVSHLYTFYTKIENLGYGLIFKRKTGPRPDGCAIYFKTKIFQAKEHVSVEFYQPKLPILNRDNIGIMLKLVPHACPDTPFVVATTHLLYNPNRTDIRLAQLQVFLAEIDRFSYVNNGKGSTRLPIILTGDLNSTPDSAVIRLLDTGNVSVDTLRDSSDWKKIEVTDNCQHLAVYLNRQKGKFVTDRTCTKIHSSEYNLEMNSSQENTTPYDNMFNSGVIQHSLDLISVYDKTKANGKQEASSFQDNWVTVDYIYFSRHSSINLLERLRLPTTQECEKIGKMPNEVYGSDHLSLGAVFELKPLKMKKSK